MCSIPTPPGETRTDTMTNRTQRHETGQIVQRSARVLILLAAALVEPGLAAALATGWMVATCPRLMEWARCES
jgi:hypothetical protein